MIAMFRTLVSSRARASGSATTALSVLMMMSSLSPSLAIGPGSHVLARSAQQVVGLGACSIIATLMTVEIVLLILRPVEQDAGNLCGEQLPESISRQAEVRLLPSLPPMRASIWSIDRSLDRQLELCRASSTSSWKRSPRA